MLQSRSLEIILEILRFKTFQKESCMKMLENLESKSFWLKKGERAFICMYVCIHISKMKK